MVPMLSELWRLMQYLLRPEKVEDPGFSRNGQDSSLAGLAKALLWAGLSVLAGLGLAQLR